MPTEPTPPALVEALVESIERLEKTYGHSMSFVLIGFPAGDVTRTSPVAFAHTPMHYNDAIGACYRAHSELFKHANTPGGTAVRADSKRTL